jgi:anti-sigma regulatory factor (Ser/Thr protein kinase)
MPATATAPWPLQTHLELGALPSAVSCARGHARSVVVEWGLADLADTVALLVSELMTNAVRASARLAASDPPIVRLWLACDQASVTIHVWDASSEMPVRRDAGPDTEGGRGLLVVDALSTDWGTYRRDNGKVVWVRLSLAQGLEGDQEDEVHDRHDHSPARAARGAG